MGLGQDSMPRAAFISGDNTVGGTGDADTTRTTCTPFLRKIWLSEAFLMTRDTLLLPFLRCVYAWRTWNPRGSGLDPHGWPSAFSSMIITWAMSLKRGLTCPFMILVWNSPKQMLFPTVTNSSTSTSWDSPVAPSGWGSVHPRVGVALLFQ